MATVRIKTPQGKVRISGVKRPRPPAPPRTWQQRAFGQACGCIFMGLMIFFAFKDAGLFFG